MATQRINRTVSFTKDHEAVEFRVSVPSTAEEAVSLGMVASESDWNYLALKNWVIEAQGYVRRNASDSEGNYPDPGEERTKERVQAMVDRYVYSRRGGATPDLTWEDVIENPDLLGDLDDERAKQVRALLEERAQQNV